MHCMPTNEYAGSSFVLEKELAWDASLVVLLVLSRRLIVRDRLEKLPPRLCGKDLLNLKIHTG